MTQKEAETVEVEFKNETVAVPTTFTYDDVAAYFGLNLDDGVEIDRIFAHDGALRAEAYVGNDTWYEFIRQTEDYRPVFNASEVGWVGQKADAPGPDDGIEAPGETLWERE